MRSSETESQAPRAAEALARTGVGKTSDLEPGSPIQTLSINSRTASASVR